jgi:hypothetical protein
MTTDECSAELMSAAASSLIDFSKVADARAGEATMTLSASIEQDVAPVISTT